MTSTGSPVGVNSVRCELGDVYVGQTGQSVEGSCINMTGIYFYTNRTSLNPESDELVKENLHRNGRNKRWDSDLVTLLLTPSPRRNELQIK
jgi:hypothetical protein